MVGMNYKITWRNIQKRLNQWNNRYLNILGKKGAVKMFIIAKKICFQYSWNGYLKSN